MNVPTVSNLLTSIPVQVKSLLPREFGGEGKRLIQAKQHKKNLTVIFKHDRSREARVCCLLEVPSREYLTEL